MLFPLGIDELRLWLSLTSIILLTTSELLNFKYEGVNIIIEKKRLEMIALVVSALFFITIIMLLYQIIITY